MAFLFGTVYILRVQKTYGRIARKVKPLAWSSAEVRRLSEEPRDSRKTSGDSVGIPAIHGGEDVNIADETALGLTPVNSSERPRTLMLPFKEVPSKVPAKMTSAVDPSSGMLMVKLNLSTLKYPLITEAVPRLLVTVPEMVPSLSMASSAVASSGPSGVV